MLFRYNRKLLETVLGDRTGYVPSGVAGFSSGGPTSTETPSEVSWGSHFIIMITIQCNVCMANKVAVIQ